MTRALNALTEAEDIGPEKAKPQEPKIVRKTDPVISVPATVPQSKIAIAVEKARRNKAAKQKKIEETRDKLEEALANSEPSRDEIAAMADAIIESATNSPEAKDAALILQSQLADIQEMVRNVHQAIGVVSEPVSNVGKDALEKIQTLIAANGVLTELIRECCAAAGTVRVDEYVPIKTAGGKFNIVRRFVDVGDEEPDQKPMLELKWLVPAAIKLRARYARLISEFNEANKRAATSELALAEAKKVAEEGTKEQQSLRAQVNTLMEQVKAIRPTAEGSPEGYYLKTDSNRWVAKYTGQGACFLNRWYLTNDISKAYSFEHKLNAEETLQRLHMAKLQRISREQRNSLRIVTIRFEDHT